LEAAFCERRPFPFALCSTVPPTVPPTQSPVIDWRYRMESILECDDREQPSVQPRHSRTAPTSFGLWRMWNCAPEKHAPVWLRHFVSCARQGTLGCGLRRRRFQFSWKDDFHVGQSGFFLVLRSADGFLAFQSAGLRRWLRRRLRGWFGWIDWILVCSCVRKSAENKIQTQEAGSA